MSHAVPRALHWCAALLFVCLPVHAAFAQATLDADTVNTAAHDAGDAAMLRAQVLLDRAHFSPGEIDGRGGSNTTRAIQAFQRHRGLEPSGELDAGTWEALTGDAAPALVAHAIGNDLAGPFPSLPEDMMEKAGLDALGFESALEALGERFHAAPALLQRLNPGVEFVAGRRILVPNVADAPALAAPDRVLVSKSDSVVRLLDADGSVYAQFPASTGSERDPLPVGEWKIEGVATDPTFHYNPELFWDADPAHAKATLAAGPNNPVGTVWIDLSKPHYGLHGTPEPGNIGKTESHGCIRMTNWSARRLADVVSPGTVAVLEE